jgi:ABC-type lipopolysaccharide export system ATPase subunit
VLSGNPIRGNHATRSHCLLRSLEKLRGGDCSRVDGSTQASSPRRAVARPCATPRRAVEQLFQIIAGIRAQGTTALPVEQNAHIALSISDPGYVLETGRLVAEATQRLYENNDEIRAAYLGGRRAGY